MMTKFLSFVLAMLVICPAAAAPSKGSAPVQHSALIGDVQKITTRYEDTLVHLARAHGLGYVEIRSANPGIDPWLPGEGTRITLPTQHLLPKIKNEGVVINLAEMRMYVFTRDMAEPLTFPIGIGRTGLTTPLGTTTVVRKTTDPTWTPTPRMLKEDPELKPFYGPGPDNPMGTHAFYLGWPSYAIHGTNKPYSIGRRLSSGCIRMYPEDVITLYNYIDVGTSVTVIDQPIKTAWIDDAFYIEVHPTQEQADILSRDDGKPSYELSDREMQKITKAAEKYPADINWALIKRAIQERNGIPTRVGRRLDRVAENSAVSNTAKVSPAALDN